MVFQIVIKNNVMKNIKDIKIRDQELLNNPLYNTSVVNPVIHKKKNEHKIYYSSRDNNRNRYNQNNYSYYNNRYKNNNRYRSNSRDIITIDLILDKDITIDLQVHTHLDPDMTTITKEELHPDLHIDHHTETTPIIDTIHDQDIDIVLNHKEFFRRYKYPYRSPSRPRDYRSRSRIPSQNTTKQNKSSRC